ncbi:hypothetical protein DFH08DRAFT_807532 [Mycena albidolilacea]|uniref:Uncharacterized protein n=1 Tax=Mycena albidolilacea TaxID=1033008 RepID=A0AAD7EU34_9AGAR|nr:hypothetical protein DFH08DRAFT_807532 [Mycena albidolilacea]
MSVEEEKEDDDTDEIFVTAPEEPSEEDEGRDGTVHTGEQSETREYLPGDTSRSPQREAVTTASTWRKAVRMVGQVIAGSIFAAAAQYGGAKLEANERGTPHGDQRSPLREVPAPKGIMENVTFADTVLLEDVVEAPRIFFKYGARQYYTRSENKLRAKQRRKLRKKTEVKEEEEVEEDVGESCGWGAVPEWIKWSGHGKGAREKTQRGTMWSPPRGEYQNQHPSCRARSLTRK